MKTSYSVTLCIALVIGGGTHRRSATPWTRPKRRHWSTTRGLRRKPRSPSRPIVGSKGDRSRSTTTKGVVMLRGKVDSDEAKRAAEGITAGLDGVKTVKNDLQIVAPSNTRRGGGEG